MIARGRMLAGPPGGRRGPRLSPKLAGSALLHAAALVLIALFLNRPAPPDLMGSETVSVVFENEIAASPKQGTSQTVSNPPDALPVEAPPPPPAAAPAPEPPPKLAFSEQPPAPPAPPAEPVPPPPAPAPPAPAPAAMPEPAPPPEPVRPDFAVRLNPLEQAMALPRPVPIPEPPAPPAPAPPPRPAVKQAAFPKPMNWSFGAPARPPPTGRAPLDLRLDAGHLGEPMARLVAGRLGDGWMQALQKWWDEHAYYPDQAAAEGQSGYVRLQVTVGSDGVVKRIALVGRSGSMWLDLAGQNTWRGLRLPPARSTDGQDAVLDLQLHYILIQ